MGTYFNKVILSVSLLQILNIGSASADMLGKCGSTLFQRLGVPEYACFDRSGRLIPYATSCAVGIVSGYQPVYFGAACEQHDMCYSNIGSRKSNCDLGLRTLIEETCDYTLDSNSHQNARTSCHHIATVFYLAVSTKGCTAFKNAQRSSGAIEPTCN